eukprot:1815507-Prymnesium_polylepis.1
MTHSTRPQQPTIFPPSELRPASAHITPIPPERQPEPHSPYHQVEENTNISICPPNQPTAPPRPQPYVHADKRDTTNIHAIQ